MADHLISPEREITIAGQAYRLDGSFRTLKAVQHAFQKDILFVQAGILEMRLDEIARLIAIASGKNEEIGQVLLDEIDVSGIEYQLLKAELLAWLAVAMTPKGHREKKSQQMKDLIEGLQASPGPSISNSASEPSAGARKRSGKATSGK